MPKQLRYLIYFKITAVLAACFSPFMHPHIIRQTDTMAVAYRYWMRWTMEPDLQHPLIPAVLTAGDGYGISTMEFPFLNLLTAPIFSVGITWGRVLSALFVSVWYLGLTHLHSKAWKDEELYGVKLSLAVWVGLIFGVSQMYWGRFMPDYLAYTLVGTAVALSYQKINWLSFPLAALGLLIKPPAIIAMGLLLLKPRKLLRHAVWILPAFILCVLYYTMGMDYIKSLSDYRAYFRVEFRDPVTSLLNFFSEPKLLSRLILKDIFTTYLLLPIGGFAAYSAFKTKRIQFKPLIGILILQILGIAALDGEHAFIHDYYFIGLSLSTAIFFLLFWQTAPKKLVIFVFVILGIYQIDRAQYEVRTAFMDNHWKQCAKILESGELDGILRIDSPKSAYPTEGLCLGKIQNAKSSPIYVEVKKNKVMVKKKVQGKEI